MSPQFITHAQTHAELQCRLCMHHSSAPQVDVGETSRQSRNIAVQCMWSNLWLRKECDRTQAPVKAMSTRQRCGVTFHGQLNHLNWSHSPL